ncbi:MAG TPA: ABC transporter substrate-binding protein [Chloroflexota bacterium]|nr:ABC transporter substrate-binding protein [Chloroflexota bacterium]
MRRTALAAALAVALLTACQPAAAPSPTAPPPPPTAIPTAAPVPPTAAPVQPTAAPVQPTTALTGKLTVDLDADVESLDPYLAYQTASLSINHNLFDYLLERDAQGNLAPGLAESWTTVDPTTLEFKLRHNIKFHNGEDFTADAVQFSAQRMLDEALNSGVRSRFTSIAEVKIVDPYTVRFLLTKPDPQLLDSLSNQMAMLPPKYTQSGGQATRPVGSGPFKFVDWVHDDHFTVEANETYWSGSVKGMPRVKTVVFRPVPVAGTRLADLQSGQSDLVVALTADQTRILAGLPAGSPRVERTDLPGYQYIFFNTKLADSPLKDARVRQALNYAIDRKGLIQSLLGGTVAPMNQALGPLTLGYNSGLSGFTYDTAKAKQLLTDAGFGNGFDLTLDVITADRTDLIDAVAAQLGQVGVRVNVQVFDGGAFNDKWLAHNMDGLFFVRWATFADPGTLNLLAACNGFLSFSCSPSADTFFKQGESTFDQAQRASAYQQAMTALNDEPFAMYLTSLSGLYGVANRVSSWKASASGYLYVTEATVK